MKKTYRLTNLLNPNSKRDFAKMPKYKKAFIDKIMLFGTLAHQHIQRIMMRQKPYLKAEKQGLYDAGDYYVAFHSDMFDPINKVVYEIKSLATLERDLDKVKLQASAYAHFLGAKKVRLISYKLNFDEYAEFEPLPFAQVKAILDKGAKQLEKQGINDNDQYQKIQSGQNDNEDIVELTKEEIYDLFKEIKYLTDDERVIDILNKKLWDLGL